MPVKLTVNGEEVKGPNGEAVMVPENITPEQVQQVYAQLRNAKASTINAKADPTFMDKVAAQGEVAASNVVQGVKNVWEGGKQIYRGLNVAPDGPAATEEEKELAQLQRIQNAKADSEVINEKNARYNAERAKLLEAGIDPDALGQRFFNGALEMTGEMVPLGLTGGGARTLVGKLTGGAAGFKKGLARVVGEGVISATEGATLFVEDPHQRATNAALGGVLGTGVGALAQGAGTMRRFINSTVLKELTRDGKEAVIDGLRLAREAELPEGAHFLPAQVGLNVPTTAKMQADVTGGIGSKIQNILDNQIAESYVQFSKLVNILDRGTAPVSPDVFATTISQALDKGVQKMTKAKNMAYQDSLRNVVEMVGGKVSKATGEIIDSGHPVIPGRNTERTVVDMLKSLDNAVGPTTPEESAMIRGKLEELLGEVRDNSGYLTLGTVDQWLRKTTKILDKPTYNQTAADIKTALLDDMATVAGKGQDGISKETVTRLLQMRADYKVASQAIDRLKETAVHKMFKKMDVDVASVDAGAQLLKLSPGNLKHSLSQIETHIGKEYADQIRAQWMTALGQKALVMGEKGAVVGMDPVVLSTLLEKNKGALGALLPKGTDKTAWLRGIDVISRYSVGRGINAQSARANANSAVLTLGSMANGQAASMGFFGKLIFDHLRLPAVEKIMADPRYITKLEELGRGDIAGKTVVIQESIAALSRLATSDGMSIKEKERAQGQRMQELQKAVQQKSPEQKQQAAEYARQQFRPQGLSGAM